MCVPYVMFAFCDMFTPDYSLSGLPFSSFFAGLMSLHILRDIPAEMALLILEVSQGLEDWFEAVASTKEPKLCLAFSFWRKTQPKVQAALSQSLKKDSDPYSSFLSAMKDALGRLELQINTGVHSYLKDIIQQSGIGPALMEASKRFGTMPPIPPSVMEMMNSIKTCHQLAEENLAPDQIKDDHDCLQNCLPRYVKLAGLDGAFLQDVCSDRWDTMQTFIKAFEDTLQQWLQGQRSFMERAQHDFDSFRRALG